MAKATLDGVVLAEGDNYQMVEGNVYFPADLVKWEYLKDGDRQYTCPWKGKTKYHDIVIGDTVYSNSAWSYPDPLPAAMYFKGHVAFERVVDVER
jgi:uncharacterized protein (DUF427 family)